MGFFDRFYYGKAGKADYTTEDMPTNRFQLFWEVLRVRFWSLMRLNLMQLVFWLPLILWTILNVMGLNAAAEQAAATGADITNEVMSLLSTYLILLIPCILITGPSTAAATYVARNWARDQHAFIWSDFKDAFKANWKQGLAISAITSVLPLMLYVGYTFYGQLSQEYPIAVGAQALLVVAVAVWLLALVFLYPLMVSYELRFKTLLRNGLLLAVGRLPFAAAVRLGTAIPFIVMLLTFFLMGNLIGVLVVVLYYLLIGFSLSRLVCASFAVGIFDKYINPRIPDAPMNMGLRIEDEDDEDEDEADAAQP